ncbi:unnamed protein product [Adineta steineri]|uniref:F-box domain-containing protein n=2 Tax=Adineta steineri TaxID=433720 RepID=A0A818YZA9_9BILA|nr:unnamed protein product [Adineta steineri]
MFSLEQLPNELLHYVLSYLDSDDIIYILEYQNATLFSKIDHEILTEFIVNDSSTVLSSLTIDGICLSIDSGIFQICHTLKRLTLSVEYQHHLFILLEYLPELEYLSIGIREGKAGKYDYNYSKTKTLKLKLRQLIISANDIDFSDLNLLLRQCQSTLEILKLRLKIDYIIDGRMLEPLKRSLKQFYFYFFCHSLADPSVNVDDLLSSFQTSSWLQDQSVMFFKNSFYQTYTIVSPPYNCHNFNCSLTNEFLNYRLNNRHEDMKMPRIKRIFLNDKQQPMYTIRFFTMLQFIFINLQILEIGSSFHLMENDDNNNYSCKTDTKLTTVHTLIIVNNQDHLNVKRLFRLLPNLYRLVIDYDLLVASIYDLHSVERQEKYQYQQLQEILIHFQPNQHIELDDDFKNRSSDTILADKDEYLFQEIVERFYKMIQHIKTTNQVLTSTFQMWFLNELFFKAIASLLEDISINSPKYSNQNQNMESISTLIQSIRFFQSGFDCIRNNPNVLLLIDPIIHCLCSSTYINTFKQINIKSQLTIINQLCLNNMLNSYQEIYELFLPTINQWQYSIMQSMFYMTALLRYVAYYPSTQQYLINNLKIIDSILILLNNYTLLDNILTATEYNSKTNLTDSAISFIFNLSHDFNF